MDEQTINELEFENAQLSVDLNLTRFDGCMLMFDQLVSMQAHVQNYGIDRTFLALYNNHGQLTDMCGTAIPSCESILSDYELNRQYFEVCMEGFTSAIRDAGLWVIKQFKRLLNWIGEMWKRFWNIFQESGGSKKVKNKVEKLRKSKLVKKIMVRNFAMHNDPNINTYINEVINLLKVDSKGNITPEQEKRLIELLSILKGMYDEGKKGKGDKPVEKITLQSDGDKNNYLNMVLTEDANIEKAVKAVGLAVAQLKGLEAQIEQNIQQQAANPDAHKNEKLKKNLKDKDQNINNKWSKQLKETRDLISILSHVMKHILNNRKVMQDDLNIIYKACDEITSVNSDFAKTNEKYNERHPGNPVS